MEGARGARQIDMVRAVDVLTIATRVPDVPRGDMVKAPDDEVWECHWTIIHLGIVAQHVAGVKSQFQPL